MLMRIGLLLPLSWVMGLIENLFTIFDAGISGRTLLLLIGGAFLIAKSTRKVYNSLEIAEAGCRVALRAWSACWCRSR